MDVIVGAALAVSAAFLLGAFVGIPLLLRREDRRAAERTVALLHSRRTLETHGTGYPTDDEWDAIEGFEGDFDGLCRYFFASQNLRAVMRFDVVDGLVVIVGDGAGAEIPSRGHWAIKTNVAFP